MSGGERAAGQTDATAAGRPLHALRGCLTAAEIQPIFGSGAERRRYESVGEALKLRKDQFQRQAIEPAPVPRGASRF